MKKFTYTKQTQKEILLDKLFDIGIAQIIFRNSKIHPDNTAKVYWTNWCHDWDYYNPAQVSKIIYEDGQFVIHININEQNYKDFLDYKSKFDLKEKLNISEQEFHEKLGALQDKRDDKIKELITNVEENNIFIAKNIGKEIEDLNKYYSALHLNLLKNVGEI